MSLLQSDQSVTVCICVLAAQRDSSGRMCAILSWTYRNKNREGDCSHTGIIIRNENTAAINTLPGRDQTYMCALSHS